MIELREILECLYTEQPAIQRERESSDWSSDLEDERPRKGWVFQKNYNHHLLAPQVQRMPTNNKQFNLNHNMGLNEAQY